ncbi:MAG: hypothetical protein M3Y93_03250 [Pseudomonadota bacterium]|nr:hypothetical protein [Pseudomonadota bacterium]
MAAPYHHGALAVPRQIQKHGRQQPPDPVGAGRIVPDQRELLKAIKLDEPTESAAA